MAYDAYHRRRIARLLADEQMRIHARALADAGRAMQQLADSMRLANTVPSFAEAPASTAADAADAPVFARLAKNLH